MIFCINTYYLQNSGFFVSSFCSHGLLQVEKLFRLSFKFLLEEVQVLRKITGTHLKPELPPIDGCFLPCPQAQRSEAANLFP